MRIMLVLLLLAAPVRAEDLQWTPHPGAAVPDTAALLTSDGEAMSFGALAPGRPLVLALGYYRCTTLCGVVRDDLISAFMASGLRAGRDADLVVLSIDPRDQPADVAQAWHAALARHGGDGTGWHFLTGDSTAVQRAVGFRARWDATLQQFMHPAGAVIVAPNHRVAAYLFGVGFDPGALRKAVQGARTGEVQPPPSLVQLLCFRLDPVTGHRTLAIERVVSLAAAVTALLVGLLLWRAHRGGRGRGDPA
ncbi:SCO family protein [Rhodovastum atsumiense]|uniref:SCO family protein n=1 Tax=Rhodovastum atsumiense TaxID=504468 RepID=A0A5M6J0R6_9PROT|nr:SCO family protein [Rhodovastum atsumiense]KAA5613245.1 SCO family protein [Rhodovastum atsumiense]